MFIIWKYFIGAFPKSIFILLCLFALTNTAIAFTLNTPFISGWPWGVFNILIWVFALPYTMYVLSKNRLWPDNK